MACTADRLRPRSSAHRCAPRRGKELSSHALRSGVHRRCGRWGARDGEVPDASLVLVVERGEAGGAGAVHAARDAVQAALLGGRV
ncbi:hypothetical protein CTI14_02360 [Methylobacterium radiotolerans]|nr:hypothetical protein CTI14_02360 [Methylobacterium radiotolerans]